MSNNMNVKIQDLFTDNDPLFGPPIVINMDKDVDRWNDICHHFSQWGINLKRFSAISGVSLPALPESMSENSMAVNLCLTHAAANRHCLINSERPMWLILEDDCRFVEDPRKTIVSLINNCQNNKLDWSVVSLGCYSYDWQGKRPPVDYEGPHGLHKFIVDWCPWGSHSYAVNRKYGMRIIEKMSSCIQPSDHVLIGEFNIGKGYLRRPSATYQEEYVSHRGGTASTKLSADLSPKLIEEITKLKIY